MDKVNKWQDFSNIMIKHIMQKGKKYDVYPTMDIMSDQFCIDSIIKYAIETKVTIELNTKPDEATLMSIAHYAQELWRRNKNDTSY
jgi:hypothetical protein